MLSPSRRLLLALIVALPAAVQAQDANIERGAALFQERKFVEARAVFTPLAGAGDPWAHYWLGRVAIAERKLDEAEKHLERAVKTKGDVSEFHLWMGRVYGQRAQDAGKLRQPGLARKTKASWERAVALDPENLDARSDLVSFYLVAPGIMGGSETKAAEQTEEIRRRNTYRGALDAARVAEHRKDRARVERELRALVSAYPDSATPAVRLAAVLSTSQQFDEAFAVIDGVLAHRPDDPAATYQLGRLSALSGTRLEDGERALQRYLAMPSVPNNQALAAAHLRLGQILERRGDAAGARGEYEAALRLDPKLDDAKKGRDRVRDRR